MQIFIRGAAKLLAFNAENDDTIQDVYVSIHHPEVVWNNFNLIGICCARIWLCYE
jgi:hypothetical protein